MSIPNAMFNEIVTSTRKHMGKQLVDNVTKHNPFLKFLKERGHMRAVPSGTEIVEPLEYGENETYTRYSGWDPLNIDESTIMTAVKFEWRQIAMHFGISGRILRQNNDPDRIVNLFRSRKKNVMKSAANKFSRDLYSAGLETDQINGLQALLPHSTTDYGSIGGINSNTFDWWAHNIQHVQPRNSMPNPKPTLSDGQRLSSVDWTPTAAAGNAIFTALDVLWPALERNVDMPDLLLCSDDFYNCMEATLEPARRYGREDTAKKGFKSIVYKDTDIIRDSNTNFASNAERMYVLNMDYLYLFYHPDANWTAADKKVPLDQDGEIQPFYWMGNLAITNRELQGVVVDV